MKIKNIKEISAGYEGIEISGTFIDRDNEEIFLKDYGIIQEDITKYVLDLQQRIDKANELLTKYFCSWDYTACEFKDVIKILSTLSIILDSENWKNRAEVKEMIEGEDNG